MKNKSNFKRSIRNLLIGLFVFTVSAGLTAQEEEGASNLKEFKILVESIDEGIKMKSIIGCEWIDLSFSLDNDRPQAIDEFGMTNLEKASSRKNSKFSGFLFTLTKTDNGIKLKGIEGTSWIELSFSLAENEKRAIDQNGIVRLN